MLLRPTDLANEIKDLREISKIALSPCAGTRWQIDFELAQTWEGRMGKRFVSTRDADHRALELHFMVREVEQMPLVDIRVEKDGKEPIYIGDRNDPSRWWTYSVENFLEIDIDAARRLRGTNSLF